MLWGIPRLIRLNLHTWKTNRIPSVHLLLHLCAVAKQVGKKSHFQFYAHMHPMENSSMYKLCSIKSSECIPFGVKLIERSPKVLSLIFLCKAFLLQTPDRSLRIYFGDSNVHHIFWIYRPRTYFAGHSLCTVLDFYWIYERSSLARFAMAIRLI